LLYALGPCSLSAANTNDKLKMENDQ